MNVKNQSHLNSSQYWSSRCFCNVCKAPTQILRIIGQYVSFNTIAKIINMEQLEVIEIFHEKLNIKNYSELTKRSFLF